MTEEIKEIEPTAPKIITIDRVEMKISMEGHEFILLLPVGAPLIHGRDAAAIFTQALSTAYTQYLEQHKEEEQKEENVADLESED